MKLFVPGYAVIAVDVADLGVLHIGEFIGQQPLVSPKVHLYLPLSQSVHGPRGLTHQLVRHQPAHIHR